MRVCVCFNDDDFAHTPRRTRPVCSARNRSENRLYRVETRGPLLSPPSPLRRVSRGYSDIVGEKKMYNNIALGNTVGRSVRGQKTKLRLLRLPTGKIIVLFGRGNVRIRFFLFLSKVNLYFFVGTAARTKTKKEYPNRILLSSRANVVCVTSNDYCETRRVRLLSPK